MLGRGVTIRGMYDSSKKGRFGQGYFTDVLIEIGQRGLAKSMDGETSAISKINFIGIKFKNLSLRESMFQFEGHHGLGDFAAQGSVTVEEKTARHLHRNRTSTLNARAMAQISPGGAKNTHGIEAGMLEETPVFYGQDGFAQHFWNVVEVHGPALLSRSAEQAAQQLRLYFGRVDGRSGIEQADFLHRCAAECDQKPVLAAEIGLRRRPDFDFGAMQNVAPGCSVHIELAVASTFQMVGKFGDGEGLPSRNSHGIAVDSRRGLLDMA